MKTLKAVAGMAVLFVVSASHGTGQVLPGPNGPVEFIGLQKWDAQELFDAIQELEPDRPFHACAAVMKRQLGFADAAAFLYFTDNLDSIDQSSNRYTVVVGVEDSTQVLYRTTGNETVVLPETWQDLLALANEDFNVMPLAATTLHMRYIGGQLAKAMGVDPETLDQVWDLVDRANGDEDFRLAHEVLARDSLWTARAVATLLLGNFIDDDSAWHGLVGSAIDTDGRVNTVAQRALDGLAQQGRHSVDWSAAHGPLSALFSGTNPFAFEGVLEVLVATDIDPEFGQQLVRERPSLLLAYVGAEHEGTREPAIAFLKALSGEDFGADLDAWTAWINR
ncbi:MAG: hypothetical protein F4246_03080 [Rhodothermaceae bacterium]|nr:hypothetical protein [Rhodothermaceae bacterium]MYD55981.1 hypothetical protein [Rhodothermaceae bacterium]MYJ55020.1 hypothetical protein [Rhodothermaceae bacterium]